MKAILNIYRPLVRFSQLLTHSKPVSTTLFKSESASWGSKKLHRKVKLQLINKEGMADPKVEEVLAPFRLRVKEQVCISSAFTRVAGYVGN